MDVVKGKINNDGGHGVKSMSGVLDRDNISNSCDNVLRAVQGESRCVGGVTWCRARAGAWAA